MITKPMDWSSAAVGLGGLVLGGVTMYLGWRGRTSPYEEKVYDRRLDAYGEVVRRLGEFHVELRRELRGHSDEAIDVEVLRQQTEELAQAFYASYMLWRVFLTRPINDQIARYVETFKSFVTDSAPAGEAQRKLDQAFEAVARAASDELGVDTLARLTSELYEPALSPGSLAAASDSTVYPDFFKAEARDTSSPAEPAERGAPETLLPGTRVEDAADLSRVHRELRRNNRNLFLSHTWRRSRTPGQVADISIRVEEKPQKGASAEDLPLSNHLVESVEYYLGDYFFGGRSAVKTNAESGFKLDISAYGSPVCVARVRFKDGTPIVLHRYLNFEVDGS
jgi:prokaryotic YEATS domain